MKKFYSAEIKKEIAEYVLTHSVVQTAKKFGCGIATVWRIKTANQLKDLPNDGITIPVKKNKHEHCISEIETLKSLLAECESKYLDDLNKWNLHREELLAELKKQEQEHKKQEQNWKDTAEKAIRKACLESHSANKLCDLLLKRIAVLIGD
jgi:hypothetical protein